MSKDATKTVDITVSPEMFMHDMLFSVSFYESGEMIPYLTGGELSFKVIDAPTGIDGITQNEKNKESEVIYDLYGQKVKNMKKGGIYITGGIIENRENDVLASFTENGFEVVERRENNGWLVFALIKK